MSTFHIHDTVGSIVARRPALSRVFEQAGIDYCCGGKKSVEDACRTKGIDPNELIGRLEGAQLPGDEDMVDASAMTLTELADHIEQTHHAYLRSELPRLDAMTEKVAAVHGDREPRLLALRASLLNLAQELSSHMMKEGRILFPMIRALEANDAAPVMHCGSIGNPIRQMEHEHEQVGSELKRQRELSDGYTPPDWACNTYRAMLDALAHLERDLHLHIHKENNVLFPRALELEQHRATAPS